jgi:G:T/U-mismatch repair DNA glycosylase
MNWSYYSPNIKKKDRNAYINRSNRNWRKLEHRKNYERKMKKKQEKKLVSTSLGSSSSSSLSNESKRSIGKDKGAKKDIALANIEREKWIKGIITFEEYIAFTKTLKTYND